MADVFFVDGVAFLMALSRRIRLTTVEYIPGSRARVLADSLKKIIRIYARGGFMIILILMGTELDEIVDRMGIAIVNTRATNEYVTDAERNVRTIKEST